LPENLHFSNIKLDLVEVGIEDVQSEETLLSDLDNSIVENACIKSETELGQRSFNYKNLMTKMGKDFQCNMCGKFGNDRSNMRKHVRKHTA
jgi:hypothetical protein